MQRSMGTQGVRSVKEVLIWLGLWGLVIALAVIITGCASWETVQSGVAVQGAKAADEALQTSEWSICEATTMGAWQRRYGENPGKAKAWAELCGVRPILP